MTKARVAVLNERRSTLISNLKSFPQEYRISVQQDHIRSLKDPYNENLTVIHAFLKVRDFTNGISDRINPRSHEKIKGRVPDAITESIQADPKWFHLLNRGCLIVAKKAWYDTQSKQLHFVLESEAEHGMVDGATTDRVLGSLKAKMGVTDFAKLAEDELPDYLREAFLHVEIIAGPIGDMLVKLADARNTSEQVKEFSLEDLDGGFDWMKDILEKSDLRGRIRYRENEPKPVDVRAVLGIFTLFNPKWDEEKKEPIVAYTGKGSVIDLYRKDEWLKGYQKLEPVLVDILKLYEYVHSKFQNQYMAFYGSNSKLGARTEVKYYKKTPKELPLTGLKTQYGIPDGWLYPLVASMRKLLFWPKNGRPGRWVMDPQQYFEKFGAELVADVVEQSYNLGSNANAAGKNRMLWSGLRTKVEMQRNNIEKELGLAD